MKNFVQTENHTKAEKLSLKKLGKERLEERERKEKIRQFGKSQMKQLGVSEWRLLLGLGYSGPLNRYQISKTHDMKYPLVHRATKGLEKIGWIRVVGTKTSEKNVSTKIYGLTAEGLLWLLSRTPKTVHPSLADFSEDDSLGLRKTLSEKDISEVRNLETQNDVYLHLLLDFDIDRIAKNNTNLFPLVFEKWDFYKKIGVAKHVADGLPEAAFSTLVEYYHNYEGLLDKLGTLEMIFAYKLYYAFLEIYSKGYVNVDAEFKDEITKRTRMLFGSSPKLQEMFEQISKEIEDRLARSLAFIKRVRANLR